jgi:hypothetical protein
MSISAIEINRQSLLEILEKMRKDELIPNTYQYAGAEIINFNDTPQIRLNFEEWSYPFVAGRETSRMLPEQFYDEVLEQL